VSGPDSLHEDAGQQREPVDRLVEVSLLGAEDRELVERSAAIAVDAVWMLEGWHRDVRLALWNVIRAF